MNYPLRHISIRVPWHDTGLGRPRLRRAAAERRPASSSSALPRTATTTPRKPSRERASRICRRRSGRRASAERVGFMAPFEYVREANHPYNRGPETSHGHFKPTPLRHPPYSAAAVPFAWMLREAMETLGEEHALDVQAEREPDLGFKTQWVQEHLNQTALLDCFAGHLKPEQSLCFFYAKQVPFVEDAAGGRILIGVGRVLHVGAAQEYAYTTKDLKGKLRSMLWERMVQHSIRPDFKDGFLLPYHAAIAKAAEDPEFDPAEIAAFSPADRLLEFSHASQLVSHDGAIASLLACAESLRKAKGVLPGPWDQCLQWIDARLGELWKARGPCPGLGSALSAFGLEFGDLRRPRPGREGRRQRRSVAAGRQDVRRPHEGTCRRRWRRASARRCAAKWSRLPDERRALLKLVSRFEITREQATTLYVQEERAKAGIDTSDAAILANPYLLYELTRLTERPRQRLDRRPRRLPGRGHPQEASAARADGARRRNGCAPRARADGQGSRRRGRQPATRCFRRIRWCSASAD